jgi:hypothetical protein
MVQARAEKEFFKTVKNIDGGAKAASQDVPVNRSWNDVPLDAVKNLPSSAANFAGGIYQAVRHPIDTFGNLIDAAAGGLKNALPSSITNAMDLIDPNPQANQRAVSTANAIGQVYKNRYGSINGLKNTIATDPVGAAADLSTILTGGAALASRVPVVSNAANALATAAKYTNPLNSIAPIVKGAADVAGTAGKNVLGVSTGVGSENIAQAFDAGLKGKPTFFDNMTGKTSMSDILDAARQNIQNMNLKKSAEYRSGMIDISKDKSVLDFGNIEKALQDANSLVIYKGQVKNAKAAESTQKITEEVQK